jgi:hypothetical protein
MTDEDAYAMELTEYRDKFPVPVALVDPEF